MNVRVLQLPHGASTHVQLTYTINNRGEKRGNEMIVSSCREHDLIVSGNCEVARHFSLF